MKLLAKRQRVAARITQETQRQLHALGDKWGESASEVVSRSLAEAYLIHCEDLVKRQRLLKH